MTTHSTLQVQAMTGKELKAAFRKSVVLDALKNILDHDDDPTLRIIARRRYLEITDERQA